MSEFRINTGMWPQIPPIYPSGPFMTSEPSGTDGIYLSDDNLYRRAQYTSVDSDMLSERIRTDPSAVDLDDFQFWTQDSWKTEHGTAKSAERFADKLVEEHEEFEVAMYGFLRGKDKQAAIKELLSEAGDVLWCVNALVSNATGNLRQGLQRYLYAASMGTLVYQYDSQQEETTLRHPVWRPKALEIATNNLDSLTYGHLDELLAQGFRPTISDLINIGSEDEVLTDPVEVFQDYNDSKFRAINLHDMAKRQYGIGDFPPMVHGADSYNPLRTEISKAGGKLVLDIGFVLHALAGITLSQAVQNNFEKITRRVQANLVDKSDGRRPEELL